MEIKAIEKKPHPDPEVEAAFERLYSAIDILRVVRADNPGYDECLVMLDHRNDELATALEKYEHGKQGCDEQ